MESIEQEYIHIRGARENNLRDISLSIPKRKITIFTGVSGSGKSSIVFDTIATEAQRQLYENFSMFVRSFLPRYAPPQADAIENLSMPIVVNQKRLGCGSHSTVDVGPHAGSRGGTIMFEGTFPNLLQSDTLTGRHMKQATPIKGSFRKATGQLPVAKANVNNLHNVSVNIPTGILTAITGVAGSGKSSLIHHVFLKQHPDAIVIDQSAVGTSTRSNPATYTGIKDDVRKAFATANKVNASLFSFNSEGACENCQGAGVTYTDLAFLDGVKVPCDVCEGKRFKEEVLQYKLDGKSIADILDLTIKEASDVLQQKEIQKKVNALCDVGLEYLTLGQPLNTLSGGECQRIKLASELHKKGSIYVLDEPTTGLHMSDIDHLLVIMNRLVDTGNTVIVIEHNVSVIRSADWIIDMGPDGGHKGGRVVFEGTPQDLLHAEASITSAYIKD